jgi:hypothetical protein
MTLVSRRAHTRPRAALLARTGKLILLNRGQALV